MIAPECETGNRMPLNVTFACLSRGRTGYTE